MPPHGEVSIKSYTLSGQGNPTIVTLRSVLHALGLDLAFTPAASTT